MKSIHCFCVLVALLFILISQPTFAEEPASVPKRQVFSLANSQHSLFVDFIRIADEAQYRGLFNIYYQLSISSKDAAVVGLSQGNDVFLFEGAYKHYLSKYFDGPFVQAGCVIGDYDGDTEVGVTGAVGYEMSLTRHLVLSGAAEITMGTMDNPVTGNDEPIFRSILGLAFAF